MAGQTIQYRLLENIRYQPQTLMLAHLIAIASNDAAGLLPPVLQGIQAEIRQTGCFRMAVNAEDAAVFFGMATARYNGRRQIGKVHCLR